MEKAKATPSKKRRASLAFPEDTDTNKQGIKVEVKYDASSEECTNDIIENAHLKTEPHIPSLNEQLPTMTQGDKIDKAMQTPDNSRNKKFSIFTQLHSNADLSDLTGIKFDLLQILTNSVGIVDRKGSLSAKEMIALTLVKLRHDLNFGLLRLLFGISHASALKYFKQTVKLVAVSVAKIINEPQDHDAVGAMHLECASGCVEQPCHQCCTVKVACTYYGSHMFKILIGLTPSNQISFHSEELESVDSCTVGGPQSEINSAAVRVHVERITHKIKSWKVLESRIPHVLAPYIDDIITVIVGIVNLSSPLTDKKSPGKL